MQDDDQSERDEETQETPQWHHDTPEGERPATVGGRDRPLVGREQPDDQRVEGQGQPEPDQERVLDPRLLAVADDEAKQASVEKSAQHSRQRDDQEKRHEGIEPEERDQAECAVATQHDQLAVRDVEHAEHPEHEREPRGRQPVESAQQDAEDQLLDEGHQGGVLVNGSTASGPR